MTEQESLPTYDVVGAQYRHDPYPTFHRLRTEQPVYYSEQWQAWLVTRYDDVLAGLEHPAISADRITPRIDQFPVQARSRFDTLTDHLSRWPLMADPPSHRWLRAPISTAMRPAFIHSLRPTVERIATELLDAALAKPCADAMAELAIRLPLYVTAEVIGVPRQAIGYLKACAVDIVNFFGAPPPDHIAAAEAAKHTVDDTVELLRPVIAARARQPRADLISNLVATSSDDGEQMTEEQIIATCVMMTFAGFETTSNLLANGLRLLLNHADQLARVRQDPGLLGGAIKEILRYESPVQRLSRRAVADLDLGGRRIRAGELIFLMAGAANRDPTIFAEPDRFDIGRDNTRQIAFGHWIHTCPGSTLAQLEAEVFFTHLFRRAPNLRLLAAEPEWQHNLSIRSQKQLWVAWDER
jgi:cytochrome P450